ncbi:BAR-domain-containing protein [Terfezia boudieri ATCC MYA-4762]|uniref:BAR-domain-containing protein n=1 Tax=Terfezia boudieri ATCC MYA-4762 TaxID=1051890 RepID=A0A3N4LV77_9PEZI|nr:BAR-domain-containing protein [Terfezia boudieri ATCC MYA-4762]
MKRLDRLKQWAGEKMGGEIKTTLSDDFKSMEAEMQLRQDGMEKLHNTMNVYVKSISKRKEAEDREKMLPLDVLAHAMIAHGEEFETDSVFGNCLINMGQANEKIARIQDSYVSKVSETWLESMERTLTQMKEYQTARRRLESRRLAYDATLTKMQKQKREDFRVEEELRAQRIKYEESNEDVLRRMTDIQESEAESVAELTAFMEAELEYHDRCRDILSSLKRQWPAGQLAARSTPARRVHSRTTTTAPPREESPPPPPQPERMQIRSRISSQDQQYRMQTPEPSDYQRPVLQRTNTTPASFDGPTSSRRGYVAEPPPLPINRSFRSTPQPSKVNTDISSHGYSQSGGNSPTGQYGSEGVSPATTHSGHRFPSRPPSTSNLADRYNAGSVRAPPPPPAPRSIGKKPPPPPPPAKRPALAARE